MGITNETKCRKCGKALPHDARFCPSCGNPACPTPGQNGGAGNDGGKGPGRKTARIVAGALFLAVAAGAVTYVVHRERDRGREAAAEALRQDSIAAAEQMAAELEEARHDSLYRNFTSPDLALLQLHGKVKEVTWKFPDNSPTTYHITPDGTCTNIEDRWEYDGRKVSVTRNADGYVTTASWSADVPMKSTDRLIWKDGVLTGEKFIAWEFDSATRHSYADGHLKSSHISGAQEVMEFKGTTT